jgi:hypothetical protein
MALRYPKDLGTEWMKLKVGIADAFTSANSRVPYQKIGAGILQVFTSLQMQAGAFASFKHPSGQTAMYIGRHFTGGDPANGMFMRRNDGTLAFWTFQKETDSYGYTAVYDQMGNIVVSDDGASGKGLARPWLAYNFVDWSELTSPPAGRQASTTTDTDVVLAHTNAQHGRVRAVVYVQLASNTAEVKFWSYPDNVLLYNQTITTSGYYIMDFNLSADWEFGYSYYIKCSIRRASATGNVGFTLISLMGAQSP